jgi:hypothetical protein
MLYYLQNHHQNLVQPIENLVQIDMEKVFDKMEENFLLAIMD